MLKSSSITDQLCTSTKTEPTPSEQNTISCSTVAIYEPPIQPEKFLKKTYVESLLDYFRTTKKRPEPTEDGTSAKNVKYAESD